MRRSLAGTPGLLLAISIAAVGVTLWLRATLDDAPPMVLAALGWAVLVAVCLGLADLVTVGYALSTRGRTRRRYGTVGFASVRDLWTSVMRHAFMGRKDGKGSKIRPELYKLPRRERRHVPLTEFALLVGRTVVGPFLAFKAWVAYIDVLLMIAPPQTGKTTWLAGRIVDAPGAALVTSTKIDLWWITHRLRSLLGPVLVFNPELVGNVPSTFRWSPLIGCADPQVAGIRATYLVKGAQTGPGVTADSNSAFFVNQAAKVLRVFLFLAAIGGKSMADVADWVNNPADETPRRLIEDYRHYLPGSWPGELAMVFGMSADKARDSIFLTLGMSVAFMDNPAVRDAVTLRAGDGRFDTEGFLRSRGTLYLIGESRDHSPLAPLLTALTGYLFEDCKAIAARSTSPVGQLNPPILIALDEAALINPVPLPAWTADAGGRGITLLIVAQTHSQLYERWGTYGGKTIKSNSNARLFLGGISDPETLEEISVMCGEREEDNAPGLSTGHGSTTLRRTVPPGLVREIPRWHVLLIYRNMRVTLLSYLPSFRRTDIKTAMAAQGPAPVPEGDTGTAFAPTQGDFPRGANPDGTASRPDLYPDPRRDEDDDGQGGHGRGGPTWR